MILKKTNRLTQAVVLFRRQFLCGVLLCNCSSAEREGLSTHVQRECSAEPFMRKHPVTKNVHISPRSSPTIFYRDAKSVFLLAHLCIAVLIGSMRRTLCSQLFMMRAWRSIYTYMYIGNGQQNPLCVKSCGSKELSISPRFSPTIVDPDANSVLLRAHLGTAVNSSVLLRAHLGTAVETVQESVKVCTKGMFSRTIYAQHPVTENLHISPRFSPSIFYRDANSVLLLYTAVLIGFAQNPVFEKCVFCIAQHHLLQSMSLFIHVLSRMYSSSTFYAQNPALEIVVQQKSVKVYLHIHVQRERSAEEPFMRSLMSH